MISTPAHPPRPVERIVWWLMAKSRMVEVFRAYDGDRLKQIGLSAEQVHRLCPEATGPGWSVQRVLMPVGEAQGVVLDWGGGLDHVHWQCPLCDREHISDFEPHADSNPVLWFCERGSLDEMCLVYWRREGGASPGNLLDAGPLNHGGG